MHSEDLTINVCPNISTFELFIIEDSLVHIHRLHEVIKLRNMEGKSPSMKSLLLDIDYR